MKFGTEICAPNFLIFFTAVDEFPILVMRGFHLYFSGEKQEK